MAIETGTVDGVVTCPPCFLAFKLYEVAKYGVVATFGCVSEGVIMNMKSWQRTPDDLKRIIEEVCSNPFRTTGGLTQKVYKEMMEEIKAKGVRLYNLPPQEEERWNARFREDVVKRWVKELEAKGLPAKKALMMFKEECDKRGVKFPTFPPEWEK